MWPQRQHLSPCVLLSGLLSLWMDLTSAEIKIQLIPQYPATGGSVTLNVTGVTGNILSFIWYKGPSKDPPYQILTYIPNDPSPLITGPLYFSRAIPFPNGSLLISDPNVTDSGHYIVKIQTDKSADVSVTLTVYEKVSKPKVTVSTPVPKENDPLTLTCDTSNAERILWSKDSAGLPPGHDLSSDNRTVTFSMVKRTDSGDYRCQAVNKVSDDISDPYKVIVNYGPENINITGKSKVYAGSVISLTCSADSVPLPEYQWKFNGTDKGTKDTLRIDRASLDHNGTYICVVNNSVTQHSINASFSVYVNISSDGSSGTVTSMDLGLIIGIVAAILILTTLAALFYLFVICKRRKKSVKNKTSVKRESSRNGQTNTAMSMEQPELQYAAINFDKNMPRKPETETEVQYAEIHLNKRQSRKKELPELQYAEIDLSKHRPRKQQQPSEMLYENRRVQQQPENVIYSDLRR